MDPNRFHAKKKWIPKLGFEFKQTPHQDPIRRDLNSKQIRLKIPKLGFEFLPKLRTEISKFGIEFEKTLGRDSQLCLCRCLLQSLAMKQATKTTLFSLLQASCQKRPTNCPGPNSISWWLPAREHMKTKKQKATIHFRGNALSIFFPFFFIFKLWAKTLYLGSNGHLNARKTKGSPAWS